MELVRTYVKAREEKDNETVLSTVADGIVFTDASNNVFTGKDAFRKYLKDNPPLPSEWTEPVEGQNAGEIIVTGKVKRFFMWWAVTVTFKVIADSIATITIVRT